MHKCAHVKFQASFFFWVQNVANLLQSSQKDAQLRSTSLKRNDQEAVAQHCKSRKKCRRKARAAQYSLAPLGAVLNGINLYHHTMGVSHIKTQRIPPPSADRPRAPLNAPWRCKWPPLLLGEVLPSSPSPDRDSHMVIEWWFYLLSRRFNGMSWDLMVIEGSLEVKLPTIWTDEKQRRAEAERRERLEERRVEEKESEERKCRCAKR